MGTGDENDVERVAPIEELPESLAAAMVPTGGGASAEVDRLGPTAEDIAIDD
ncbi:MAG: hypothetical protein ACJA0P_004208, partial [Planctomycetota bacterium]